MAPEHAARDTGEPEAARLEPAPVDAAFEPAEIFGRRALPPARPRDVPVFFPGPRGPERRVVPVARATHFDEMLIAVHDDVCDATPAQLASLGHWHPEAPRLIARELLKDVRRVHRSIAKPLTRDEILFDARGLDPNNLAHLLVDIVPWCLYVQQTLGPANVRSVFVELDSLYRGVLDVIGLRYLESGRRLGGRIAHVRGRRGLASYDLPFTLDLPGMVLCGAVYDSVVLPPPARPMEKLFFARRGTRALSNQAEVEALLSARGYVTYYPEDHPLREQLSIAQHARHVVGIHGAGLGELVLNPRLGTFVELLTPHSWHPYYPLALGERVARCAQIVSAWDERVAHGSWSALRRAKQGAFHIALEALDAALDEVGG